ncbi:hypothetical protein L1987_06425 [Smallanthus sonchifolius]|uniref:Uncharacterized protein n=1 Tax=Smallanthus sonchifolius TaxID=185202 RepID=A0ACB9JY40_9ASTR|nr:hypothetical protein L1987_06425 [Smallanthus sonchifolius]
MPMLSMLRILTNLTSRPRSNWDVLGWKKLVTELSGEPMPNEDEGKPVAEGEVECSTKAVKEVVDQDNDGKDENDRVLHLVFVVLNCNPVCLFEQ